MTVLAGLLTALPTGGQVVDLYVGRNWILSVVEDETGSQSAGVASTPKLIAPESPFQPGYHAHPSDPQPLVNLLTSADETAAAVGLATLNALLQPSHTALTTVDAADWLSEQCKGRNIAIFGRFPFIQDEIRAFAKRVFVFEQTPAAGEFGADAMPSLLPQADIVAITGSAIINHTIDSILPHIAPDSTVVVLGPSTPLAETLFQHGIDGLFGVRVSNIKQAVESVLAGDGFQAMQGLQRVSLFKNPD
jgi:hypothetical protein